MVSAVDLREMADSIHLDYEAQQRLGKRLASIILTEVYNIPGHATPIELDAVYCSGDTIRIQFKGVNGKLTAPGDPLGFSLKFSVQVSKGAEETVLPTITSVAFDPDQPNTVIIKCSKALKPEWKPMLYYASGLNPECNVVDEKDIPVPAFGPISLDVK